MAICVTQQTEKWKQKILDRGQHGKNCWTWSTGVYIVNRATDKSECPCWPMFITTLKPLVAYLHTFVLHKIGCGVASTWATVKSTEWKWTMVKWIKWLHLNTCTYRLKAWGPCTAYLWSFWLSVCVTMSVFSLSISICMCVSVCACVWFKIVATIGAWWQTSRGEGRLGNHAAGRSSGVW